MVLPAVHVTESAAVARADCAAGVPTQPAAVDLAVACDQPVEVLDARTPWDTLTALPTGELRWESSTLAQRTEVNGGWQPVETVLAAGPDGVTPAAPVVGMRFSPGGADAPLARIEHEGRALEMS